MERPSVFYTPFFRSTVASVTHLHTLHRLPDDTGAWVARAPGAGAGEPAILLLHGAGMDHRAWEAQLVALGRRGVRAYAADLPGHGHSSGPAFTGIAALASWTLQLVDVLALERLALAGHSMGALIALDAAARLGDRVTGLALIGAALEMPVNPALLTAAGRDLDQAATMIASWAFGPAAQSDGRAEAGRQMILGASPGVLAADLAACASFRDAASLAGRVTCPALVVAGAMDRMTPARRGRALAEALCGAEFVELPEIGHMLPSEAPDAVTDALVRIAGGKRAGR